jgi:hypothetical protein
MTGSSPIPGTSSTGANDFEALDEGRFVSRLRLVPVDDALDPAAAGGEGPTPL